MKSSEVLKSLKELRITWRKQSFSYTVEQQAEYNRLVALRRERVKYLYDNDMVYKGGTKQATPTK
jgi:hypothetical protein|tara:strand:- start:545 stop:739 length:195 start_codon:yes stop_codon:yes gene_type:complete